MIHVEYQGRGMLAIIGLGTSLATVGALITVNVLLMCAVAGLGLIGCGLLCRYMGRRWKAQGAVDTLYGTTVDAWGDVYLWCGGIGLGLLSCLVVTGVAIRLARGMPVAEMFKLNP